VHLDKIEKALEYRYPSPLKVMKPMWQDTVSMAMANIDASGWSAEVQTARLSGSSTRPLVPPKDV